MSNTLYRTCVPDPGGNNKLGWCVLIRTKGNKTAVIKYGAGPSNAAQFLKFHPDYVPERRYQ
jgi:hypothetical protein